MKIAPLAPLDTGKIPPAQIILDSDTPGQIASCIICYGAEVVAQTIAQAKALQREKLAAMLPTAEIIAVSIGPRQPAPGPTPPAPTIRRQSRPRALPQAPATQIERVILAFNHARGRKCLQRITSDYDPAIVRLALGTLPQSFVARLRSFARETGVILPEALIPQTPLTSGGKRKKRRKHEAESMVIA